MSRYQSRAWRARRAEIESVGPKQSARMIAKMTDYLLEQ